MRYLMTKTIKPVKSKDLEADPAENIQELEAKITTLSQENDDLKKEIDTLDDKLKRLAAEFENSIRNSDKKQKQTRDFAISKLVEQLILTVDAMESGLSHMPDPKDNPAIKSLCLGLDMIHKMLLKTLEENGLKTIEALGQNFDPKLHEVIETDKVSDKPNNAILSVRSPGYELNGRLIRPAKVVINQINTDENQSKA